MQIITDVYVPDEALAAAQEQMVGRFVPNDVVGAMLGAGMLLWDADKVAGHLIAEGVKEGRFRFTNENDRAYADVSYKEPRAKKPKKPKA